MSYIVLSGFCVNIILNVRETTNDKSDDWKDVLYHKLEQLFDQLRKYEKNTPLRNVYTKLRWADIFKPATGNKDLHKGVRIVNFATSKNLIKSTAFPHWNIHEYI
jgi:hypothetical protein